MLLENSCCCVQAFELPLCYKIYQSSFEQKSNISQCMFNTHKSDRYTSGRPTNWWASRQPFPSSVKGVDLGGFFVCLKLFALHIESAEVSIFLFLPPVQTVKNKSRAPDIILLQQWGDGLWFGCFLVWGLFLVLFFFPPREIFCEYMALFPKGNRLETCLGIRSRSVCCHSNFALVTIWNSALPLKKRAEASPKRWEKNPLRFA